ncbi:hypothetical protein D9M68_549200 [compost metagenome]
MGRQGIGQGHVEHSRGLGHRLATAVAQGNGPTQARAFGFGHGETGQPAHALRHHQCRLGGPPEQQPAFQFALLHAVQQVALRVQAFDYREA